MESLCQIIGGNKAGQAAVTIIEGMDIAEEVMENRHADEDREGVIIEDGKSVIHICDDFGFGVESAMDGFLGGGHDIYTVTAENFAIGQIMWFFALYLVIDKIVK